MRDFFSGGLTYGIIIYYQNELLNIYYNFTCLIQGGVSSSGCRSCGRPRFGGRGRGRGRGRSFTSSNQLGSSRRPIRYRVSF